jgi:hypothetical protein
MGKRFHDKRRILELVFHFLLYRSKEHCELGFTFHEFWLWAKVPWCCPTEGEAQSLPYSKRSFYTEA